MSMKRAKHGKRRQNENAYENEYLHLHEVHDAFEQKLPYIQHLVQ